MYRERKAALCNAVTLHVLEYLELSKPIAVGAVVRHPDAQTRGPGF